MTPSEVPYPCTVVLDRYTGSYSGALWLAWNLEPSDVPPEVDGDDGDCRDFWAEHAGPVGKGATPDAAVFNLLTKLMTRGAR